MADDERNRETIRRWEEATGVDMEGEAERARQKPMNVERTRE